jgi:hypothetical protein
MTKARELSELAKAVTISDNRIDFDRELQLSNASITADVNFGDNDKVIFGAGNDLQIYHDAGGNSFINESGFGSLFMQGDNIRFRTTDGTGTYALFTNGGAVDLYHNNSLKLATTATGVTVTGTVTAGDITLSDNNPTIIFDDANGVDQNFTFAVNGGTANIQSRTDAGVNTTRFTVSSNGNIDFKGGDISFYEDTGTTPKFFWDASAECLNVGTTTSEGKFNVNVSAPADYPFRLTNTSSTGYGLLVTAGNGSSALAKFRDYAGNDRVYISGAGNVGIGTNSPTAELTIGMADLGSAEIDFRGTTYSRLGIIKVSHDSGTAEASMRFHTRTGGSEPERMRITSSGNVGIGTTSPNSKLDVATGANGVIFRYDTASTFLQIFPEDANGDISLRYRANSGSAPDLLFKNDAGTERMRITDGGNVGIGTNSPSELIHANGSSVSGLQLTTNTYTNGTVFKVQGDGASYIYNTENAMLRFGTNNLERIRIDSSGRVGIGATALGANLNILGANSDTWAASATNGLALNGNTAVSTITSYLDTSSIRIGAGVTQKTGIVITGQSTGSGSTIQFRTGNSERMRINSAGSVSIGTSSSPNNAPLLIKCATDDNIRIKQETHAAIQAVNDAASAFTELKLDGSSLFLNSQSGGNVLVGITTNPVSQSGLTTGGQAFIANSYSAFSRVGGVTAYFNRQFSDGDVIAIRQDGSDEGFISVSGTTVTYGGGHLARWSRLLDNSKDTTIVKGTVMTNLNEMVEWSHDEVLWIDEDELPDGVSVGDVKKSAYTEDNEQLNKMAVSSVEGDANVAGVFVSWHNDDDGFNDMIVAMTGDMVIRISQGTTVARGDLLMSAGDGTAKPQGDDIVRSKTIAKVTSTNVSHTYDDGTYLVPCVLMAC